MTAKPIKSETVINRIIPAACSLKIMSFKKVSVGTVNFQYVFILTKGDAFNLSAQCIATQLYLYP